MSKIVFEVLIDTGFADICTNPDLAPIDNKSVLSFLNDFEEGKWRNALLHVLKNRDPYTKYDWFTNILYYKGKSYDLGGKAGYKLLEHYNTYIIDGDIKSAGETIKKFKRFFPKYDMGDYFSAYYKALDESKITEI